MAKKPAKASPKQGKKSAKNINIELDKLTTEFRNYFFSGQFEPALEAIQKVHKLIPANANPLSDAAATCIYLSRWDDAINYALKSIARDPKLINSYDSLAHAYGSKADWENAGKYGLIALQLRHKKMRVLHPILPKLPEKAATQGKNIVSFSLFGSLPAYVEPSVINCQIAKEIYPDWTLRFYIDETVNAEAQQRLCDNGAELVMVDEATKKIPATMWRFLALDDPLAHFVIFRDADSVISQREAKAVQEWMASGKLFHTMRDSGSHTELMLAGLWGAVAGSIPNMRATIERYMNSVKTLDKRFADQYFLRDYIWPYAHQSLYATDRLFNFMDAHPFDDRFFDYKITHIGCDEASVKFAAQSTLAVGTPVLWNLYSEVSPLLNEDLSLNFEPERLVCRYPSTINEKGEVIAPIPRRYARGFELGKSKVIIDKAE